MIYLGTSGYSYDDWLGRFYPEKLPKKDFFEYYQRFFNCVEINFTHYTLPSQSAIKGIIKRAPESFKFSVKSFKDMTIGRTQDPTVYANYRYSIDPIVQAGQLLCVLLQFPNRFDLTRDNVHHLQFIRDQWPELPLAVEFRHRSWVEDERTWDFLREQKIAYCCVDEPRMADLVPPITRLTADFAYVRFHGRSADKWYGGDHAWTRYNYLYNREELSEWVEPVEHLAAEAKDVMIFFNNHYGANAVQNALEFAELIGHRPV